MTARIPSMASSTALSHRQSAAAPAASSSTLAHRRNLPASVLQDRPVTKTRGHEVALASWAFLFSAMVQYTQERVAGISEFEKRLNAIGSHFGARIVELLPLRDSLPPSTSRNATGPPRTTRLLPLLQYIHTPLFRYLFNKPADALERSTDHADEYMVYDNDPMLTRAIHVPAEMSSLSCSAITAGIIEAVMNGWGFPSKVTAHSVPTTQFPNRTVLLIKLESKVIEREAALGSK